VDRAGQVLRLVLPSQVKLAKEKRHHSTHKLLITLNKQDSRQMFWEMGGEGIK